MSDVLRLDPKAKNIFLEVYNNPEVKSIQIHSVITSNLIEEGYLSEDSLVLDKDLVRDIFKNTFNLEYRNRPRKQKVAITSIVFEEDDNEPSSVAEEVEEMDEVGEVSQHALQPAPNSSPYNWNDNN